MGSIVPQTATFDNQKSPSPPFFPKIPLLSQRILRFPCYTKTIAEFQERSRVWAEQKNGWFSRKPCYNASVPWPWPGPVAAAGYGRGAAAAGAPLPLCAPAAGHHLARGWVLVHHLVHLSEDCRRVPCWVWGSAWGLAPWRAVSPCLRFCSALGRDDQVHPRGLLYHHLSDLDVLGPAVHLHLLPDGAPIIYSNVLQSIHSVDRQMLEAVKVFRLSWPKRVLSTCGCPSSSPYLLSACGVSLGISWKAGIAAEIIGIPAGSIGRMFYDAKVYFNTVDLFAWTVIVVVISVLFEKRLPGPAAGGLSKGGNTVNDLILEQVTKGFGDHVVPARILCPVSRGAVYLHHGALRLRENYPCFVSSWVGAAGQRTYSGADLPHGSGVPGNRLFEDFSALSNVTAVCSKERRSEAAQHLTASALGRAFTPPSAPLSGGMKRRVAVARAVLAPGEILDSRRTLHRPGPGHKSRCTEVSQSPHPRPHPSFWSPMTQQNGGRLGATRAEHGTSGLREDRPPFA